LLIYRFALFLLAPILAVIFALRLSAKETANGLRERFGRVKTDAPKQSVIWLHGASIGELTAARTLISTLLERHAQLSFIVTMNSYTARKMVLGWDEPRINASLAPLDYRIFIRRFLNSWKPVALISLENELWPNRLSECKNANIPVLIAGGRLSEKAAVFWGWIPGLAQTMLGNVTYLAPQDAASRERFIALGLPPDAIGPILNLKSTVELPPPSATDLRFWSALYPLEKTFLAASTHDGEDRIILDAFEMARREIPDLRLILAPRHPERTATIEKLISSRPLTFLRKSSPSLPDPAPDVLVADTLGEMALWYKLAFATFVGGTLVEKGGHTPIEPMQFRSVVLHGPSVSNHQAAFSQLDDTLAAICISDAKTLCAAIVRCSDTNRRVLMVASAARVLDGLREQSTGQGPVLKQITNLMSNNQA